MLKLSLISVIFLYFFGSIRCETFSGANFFIQWANLGDETQFFVTSTLSSSVNASNAWLAVGFTLNNSNSASNIVVCQNGVNSGQSVSHYAIQYAGNGNQASLLDSVNPDTGLADTLVMTANGNLTCYFSRYNVLLVNQYIPVVDGSSFLFFTFGPGDFSSSYNASNIAMSNQGLSFSTSNISSWTLTSPQTTTWTSFATTTKPGVLNQLVHNILNSIFSLFSSLFR